MNSWLGGDRFKLATGDGAFDDGVGDESIPHKLAAEVFRREQSDAGGDGRTIGTNLAGAGVVSVGKAVMISHVQVNAED